MRLVVFQPCPERTTRPNPGCTGSAVRGVATFWAEADHLEGVRDVDEAVLTGHLVGPALDLRTFHLDSATTGTTQQVVMMGRARAAPKEHLAGIGSYGVNLTRFREGTELVVDRGQSDIFAPTAQLRVEILRAAKPGRFIQQRRKRPLLPRRTRPGSADSRTSCHPDHLL